jgi:hypothetical protein
MISKDTNERDAEIASAAATAPSYGPPRPPSCLPCKAHQHPTPLQVPPLPRTPFTRIIIIGYITDKVRQTDEPEDSRLQDKTELNSGLENF